MLSKYLSYALLFKARLAGLFAIAKENKPALALAINNSVFCAMQAYYLLWKDPNISILSDVAMKFLHHGSVIVFSFTVLWHLRVKRVKDKLSLYIIEEAWLTLGIYSIICFIYYILQNQGFLIFGGTLLLISMTLFIRFINKLFSTKIA